jgi:hypothetical protein
MPGSGAFRPQITPRAKKIQISMRKATPVIAEVRNTSLNVTAHVLFWPVP